MTVMASAVTARQDTDEQSSAKGGLVVTAEASLRVARPCRRCYEEAWWHWLLLVGAIAEQLVVGAPSSLRSEVISGEWTLSESSSEIGWWVSIGDKANGVVPGPLGEERACMR